tara:strand:- start:70 stop:243 length:174 start_codon:yes stop_codon:yes gene_type:complete
VSVTEQMLIHAQEFNSRIDSIEVLVQDQTRRIDNLLMDLREKLDILEVLMLERKYHD